MVARVRSVAIVGLDPVAVTVEAHVGPGLPGLHIIGSAGSAARESADRVRTALSTLDVRVPQQKMLVSLAPAEVPKVGARFDLPTALALLMAFGALPAAALDGTIALGELALDGAVRPVPGVLPSVAGLVGTGTRRLVVAEGDAVEALLGEGPKVVPVASLEEALAVLSGRRAPREVSRRDAKPARTAGPDLADVRGQAEARRALEIAAAGAHHLLLVGPPGCGKSMLAARLPGLLPALTEDQALELAAVRSVAGVLDSTAGLDRRPPFADPHHSTTAPALLGGGSGIARPGHVSLASHGVLFLDELFEWPRRLLEALRQPLQSGVVRLARAQATVRYPAKVLLVAAANPCPCGGGDRCACADDEIWRYRAKLSGPLADRLDLAPAVAPITGAALLEAQAGEDSATVAARVARARSLAGDRLSRACRNAGGATAGTGGASPNAMAPVEVLRPSLRPDALRCLAAGVDAGDLTARGFDRALRVARTIADLAESETVEREHVLEAVAHRMNLQTQRALVGVRS